MNNYSVFFEIKTQGVFTVNANSEEEAEKEFRDYSVSELMEISEMPDIDIDYIEENNGG